MEPCRETHIKQKQDECGNRQSRLSSFIPTHRSKCDRLRPSKMQQVPRHKSSQKHTNNPFLLGGDWKNKKNKLNFNLESSDLCYWGRKPWGDLRTSACLSHSVPSLVSCTDFSHHRLASDTMGGARQRREEATSKNRVLLGQKER